MNEIRSIELFDFTEPVEIRAAEGDKPAQLTGYAAVFNSLSKELAPGFRERILPGAFATALASGADIRALVDHDPSKLLGRTSNRTLRVGENDKGLWVSIDLPDTTYARDLAASVKRGDIRGMSFGFKAPKGADRFIREGNVTVRELVQNIDLREVTVTSVPAYGDTSLSLRVDPAVLERISATGNAKIAHLRRLIAVKG